MSEPTQGRSRSYDSWSLVTRILKGRICAYRVLWSTPSFLLLFFLLFSLYSVLFPYFVSAFLSCVGICMSCLLFGSFVGVVLCENCLTLFGSSLKFKKKKLVSYFEKRMWVRLKPIKSEIKTKYVVIMLHRKKFHCKIFDKRAHACINALKQHISTQFLFSSTIEKQL